MVSLNLWRALMIQVTFFTLSSVAVNPQHGIEDSSLLIKTTAGTIRGLTMKSRSGIPLDAFLGIPYAEPPLGKLRFKHPLPKKTWYDILDTVSMPYSCPVTIQNFARHIPFLRKQMPATAFDEDCLKLNIWVPKPRQQEALLPVIVFLHGGGYSFGSSTVPSVSGETLASQENVIVVSLNYRLASLGFLYLDHPEIPGNAGLYDQVLALKWVQDNAKFFGGDPDNVALMGESAGATSAAFLAFSNTTRHLFKRLILMSPVLRKWSVMSKEDSLNKGYEMIANLGCPADRNNVSATFNCLILQSPDDLLGSEPVNGYSPLVFRPVIDNDLVKEWPEETLESGKIQTSDLLLGSNRNEGTLFLIMTSPHIFQVTKDVVKPGHIDYLDILKDFFLSEAKIVNDTTLIKLIDFHYTNWQDLDDSEKIINAFEKTINDYFFACSTNRISNVYTQSGSNVFRYFYTHPAPSSYAPKWMGAFHGAENHYVFGEVFDFKPKLPEEEIEFSKRIMRYWANFARTGDPNIGQDGSTEDIHWPKYESTDRKYLVLSPKSSAFGKRFREKDCIFWDSYLPALGYKSEV